MSEPATLVTRMKRELFGNTYDLEAYTTEFAGGFLFYP
jgi:hypothetical protein